MSLLLVSFTFIVNGMEFKSESKISLRRDEEDRPQARIATAVLLRLRMRGVPQRLAAVQESTSAGGQVVRHARTGADHEGRPRRSYPHTDFPTERSAQERRVQRDAGAKQVPRRLSGDHQTMLRPVG
ncbi:hypothetical protein MML48_8g00009880 [Holotrichia oblita]|uniref:Uncharacterized protein n=1 Tax=Holotrichia oblita TaxID=644536 RepID=A0ACB9STW2_HOLOL|nr:hypothetical protein MML48_8g00009880 [Holotrichia oblita]